MPSWRCSVFVMWELSHSRNVARRVSYRSRCYRKHPYRQPGYSRADLGCFGKEEDSGAYLIIEKGQFHK